MNARIGKLAKWVLCVSVWFGCLACSGLGLTAGLFGMGNFVAHCAALCTDESARQQDATTNQQSQKTGKQSESTQRKDSQGPPSPSTTSDASSPQETEKRASAARPMDAFVRLRRDARGKPLALETAIVHYQLPTPGGKVAHVDLVAAVHVGEKKYYEELNQRFSKYEAVLFELVAPEDFRAPEGRKLESQSFVGFIQNGLKSLLGLEFQLHGIDYARPNFVHADMSPEEFEETMRKRGESFWQMFLKLLRHGMEKQAKQPSNTSDLDFLLALLKQDRLVIKRVLAEELAANGDALAAISGEDGGSTIITERNKKALEVLRRELQNGKTRLAIFYGAGHLPDMEARLMADFNAKRMATEWLVAWDLEKDHSRPAPKK